MTLNYINNSAASFNTRQRVMESNRKRHRGG